MSTFDLKVVDRGWKKIVKISKQIAHRKSHAKAGVLGTGTHKKGELSLVELALIHELGAPGAGIPERSFIRSSFEAHRPEYIALLKKFLPKVQSGQLSIVQVLGLIGAKMAADMKKGITTGAGIPPPLKPATIAAKGSSRPLLDTGQLVNSITYTVVS